MIRTMDGAGPREGGLSGARIVAFGFHQGLRTGRRGGCRGVTGKRRRQNNKFKERQMHM